MVARTPPPKLKKKTMVAPLDPNQLRQTLNKVEKCMARLQELQYITTTTTVGGTKVITLSPTSTRGGYLKASLRSKQESLRIRNSNAQKSPNGKLPTQLLGEWKRMSLPAMLLGETVGEILQASQFAREIVAAVDAKQKKMTIAAADPKTPVTDSRGNSRLKPETTDLNARRKREKQIIRSDPQSPLLHRARSRINFKVSGSPPKKEIGKENCRFAANRVSPKHRPWARKTVIFPNPLFHSSPNLHNPKFKSPVIPRNHPTTPHKFLIKTPPAAAAARKKTAAKTPPAAAAAHKKTAASSSSSVFKFQVKIRSPTMSVSPTRPATAKKRTVSPTRPVAAKKKAVSPPKKVVSTAAKIRRSFSPSRLASKLASPLKSRKLCLNRSSMDGMMMNMMSGLKQRPGAMT